MLKIKNYIFPIEQIVYITYRKVTDIIYIALKNTERIIQIENCTQQDFDNIRW